MKNVINVFENEIQSLYKIQVNLCQKKYFVMDVNNDDFIILDKHNNKQNELYYD